MFVLLTTLLREYGMPFINYLFSKPWFSMPTKMPGRNEIRLFDCFKMISYAVFWWLNRQVRPR